MGEKKFLNLASDEKLVKCLQKRELSLGNPLSKQEITSNLERLDKIMIPFISKIEIEENHDPYRHGLELIDNAQKVARILKCSAEETLLIGLAAYLHDIGKRAVYDSIINKPSQLTLEEYREVQKHVTFGEQIAKPFTYIGKLIKYHHERLDGRGYMEGLKGNDIPLGSRIICVVDAYNAMTHKRIYDSRHGEIFAINELQRCSGVECDTKYIRDFRLNILKELSCNCSAGQYKGKLLEILCKKGEFSSEDASKTIEELEQDYMRTRVREEEQFDKAVVAAFLFILGAKNKRYIPKTKKFGYIEVVE